MSEDPIIAKVQALLGEFSRWLYFTEEGDMVLAKPKQFLAKNTFEELRQRVEKIGGQYVDLNTGFKIAKATLTGDVPLEKPVEESLKTIPEEPKPVEFEPTIAREPAPRTEEVLTVNIKLDNLETGVFSPRKTFSERYVDELSESIKFRRQFKPIVVRPHPEKPHVYQIIDGEHRVRAFRKLGRSLIRAEVRMLSDDEADLLAMRINQMHGKRLEDLEEGLHIKKMTEQHGWSQRDIAERLRRSLGWVNGRLALANKLSPETKEAFTRVNITKRKAIEIAELPKEIQPSVVARVVKEKLSFNDTETLVHAIKDHPDKNEEILTKPVNELTPPPMEVEEFEEKHEPGQPKFETGHCPQCGAEYVVNWPLCRINWREKTRE